jgi:hypothetical protein
MNSGMDILYMFAMPGEALDGALHLLASKLDREHWKKRAQKV